MKSWQRAWLYTIASIAVLHFVRDVSQDLGIQNALSTPFVKTPSLWYPWWYFWVFNTYAFSVVELLLVFWCFKRNRFSTVGYFSIALATIIFGAWLVYWFFL